MAGRGPRDRHGVAATYVSWIVWELRVSVRDASSAVHADRWTAEAYAIAQGATAIAAVAFLRVPPRTSVLAIGASAFVAGGALRIVAVHTLGAFYSHRVRLTDDHAVVSTGPYRWLRHPAYAGMLLAHAGLVTVFFNGVAAALLVAALLPAIVVRIGVEERALRSLPGYDTFCDGRARIVPGVW